MRTCFTDMQGTGHHVVFPAMLCGIDKTTFYSLRKERNTVDING